MEVFSYIILIILSLFGYSAGAVGKAGKFVDLRPQLIDLIIILVIWIGAVYSRIVYDLNKWLIILIWLLLSSLIGILAIWPRNLSREKDLINGRPKEFSSNLFKKLWQSWGNFSKRRGSFQSRIILSLFFFIFVTPFALGVKIFSNPLNIKYQNSKSHWLPKKNIKMSIKKFRRQF